MTHLSVREWGRVPVGEDGFTRDQANILLAAARAHLCGGSEGTSILTDHHRHLTAKQVVGVLAGTDCSLEILPKVDPERPDEDASSVRRRLIDMLDVAVGLDLSAGAPTELDRQGETLLDILIRLFASRLLDEVRRGLPRLYRQLDEDLPALRGRIDVTRQFTVHAVRTDRLACRFDALEGDTPLLQIMKAAVVFLGRHARTPDARRQLGELRHLLDEVSDVAPARLPWELVQLDRSNRRWRTLLELARLFLKREWQATHHRSRSASGIALLFPMNDLFEAFVAGLLRRAFAGADVEVVAQGGLRYCLGDWADGADCTGTTFQTRPDIIIRRGDEILAIIDTKWKAIAEPFEGKGGVSQPDVYQMMAYSRLYRCRDLMLLYPSRPDEGDGERKAFGLHGGAERLRIAQVDVSRDVRTVVGSLSNLLAHVRNLPHNGRDAKELLVSSVN